jgi:glycosyltransferase involved in cell wall biosynthesis
MNVLLLSARFPWPAYTGDRLRTQIWLTALEREANVALVAPAGEVPPNAPRFRFHPAARSVTCALRGAARIVGGAPLQSLLAAPYDWPGAIARAQKELGAFDATIVLLSRLDPAVRQQLQGFRVLDAIDSLRRSMDERARKSSAATRWLWRMEARRVARVEHDAAHTYDRVLVVNPEDCAELRATAVPLGVEIAPLGEAPRTYDFAFWGQLAYFANADAAAWLIDEIWPAIRARLPHATLLLGGANAPARLRAMHGRAGITVQCPVPDVARFARSAKIALFPVRFGTGQSSKVLEAAEGGCAIVATPKAMRALEPLAPFASIAEDAQTFAQAAIDALANDAQRTANAGALRAAVTANFARQTTLDRLAAIVQRAEAAA